MYMYLIIKTLACNHTVLSDKSCTCTCTYNLPGKVMGVSFMGIDLIYVHVCLNYQSYSFINPSVVDSITHSETSLLSPSTSQERICRFEPWEKEVL